MIFYNNGNTYILSSFFLNQMAEKSRLLDVAELIAGHLCQRGIDQYCRETGITKEDFVAFEPQDSEGEVFAVDGSNIMVCDWSAANLNKIRAGYAVYRGREWQRTVITYDDVFLADAESYAWQFVPDLEHSFGISRISLEESDLDRLSTYFREMQEYIALNEAISVAQPGDLVLHDGGFDVFEPLRTVLQKVIRSAQRRNVDLLGISKSSTLFWGKGLSRPLVQHTGWAGGIFLPDMPWYVSLKGKGAKPEPKWDGETLIVRFDGGSSHAFKVDVPSYLRDRIGPALAKAAACSCSAECLGYPHPLFRAHRDIRISSQEKELLLLELMDLLSVRGVGEQQVRTMMQDFHDVLEMRQGF
jgi:hypothetical protein